MPVTPGLFLVLQPPFSSWLPRRYLTALATVSLHCFGSAPAFLAGSAARAVVAASRAAAARNRLPRGVRMGSSPVGGGAGSHAAPGEQTGCRPPGPGNQVLG